MCVFGCVRGHLAKWSENRTDKRGLNCSWGDSLIISPGRLVQNPTSHWGMSDIFARIMQSPPACQIAWKSIRVWVFPSNKMTRWSLSVCPSHRKSILKWLFHQSGQVPSEGPAVCVCASVWMCSVCVALWRKSFIRVTGMNDSTLRSFKGLFLQSAVDTSALRRWAMMGLQWKPPNSKSFLFVHLCLTPAVVRCPSKPQNLSIVFVEN